MQTYTFHQDPAHGWLEVPLTEVSRLNIKPSRYSYRNNENAYLEEDCDLALFIAAKKALGEAYTFSEKHTNGDSFVRRLPSF